MRISAEGQIGIWLALFGLAGAGSVVVAPADTEIGWTLIAVAVIGAIVLTTNHFWSPIRESFRSKTAYFPVLLGMLVIFAGGLMFWHLMSLPRVVVADPDKKFAGLPDFDQLVVSKRVLDPGYFDFMINSSSLKQYRYSYNVMVIGVTQFPDVDIMTSKNIAKGDTYTITGGLMPIGVDLEGKVAVAINKENMARFFIIIIPKKVSPNAITCIADVEPLGGKIVDQSWILGTAYKMPYQP